MWLPVNVREILLHAIMDEIDYQTKIEGRTERNLVCIRIADRCVDMLEKEMNKGQTA